MAGPELWMRRAGSLWHKRAGIATVGCTKVTYDVELKAISLDIAVYG